MFIIVENNVRKWIIIAIILQLIQQDTMHSCCNQNKKYKQLSIQEIWAHTMLTLQKYYSLFIIKITKYLKLLVN